MPQIILFNKPYNVLSQFTDDQGRKTLADYLQAPGFRAAGRLDYDSEGLLVLTDDGRLQQHIAHPANRQWKQYLAQVEGTVTSASLQALETGVVLKDGTTLPARAARVEAPDIWLRDPPIRVRKSVPDCWISLSICEGRNRQVRRMTAAVGFPTLRLIRTAVGDWSLDDLLPGEYTQLDVPAAPRPEKRPSRVHKSRTPSGSARKRRK